MRLDQATSMGEGGIFTDMGKNTDAREDERLLRLAEEALTEIKVSTGLSEPHAAVLAALRIRLRGEAGSSLDELIAAAEDREGLRLEDVAGRTPAKPSTSLDDLFTKPQKPKRSLDDLLG